MHAAIQNLPSRQTLIRALIIGALSTGLVACGGGGPGGADLIAGGSSGGGGGGTTPAPSATPTISAARLSLNWDKTSVKTGGTDAATLTITALNASNGILANATILLSSTSGTLSATVVTTDAKGQAKVTYSAGDNLNNRTETITITSGIFSTTTAVKAIGT
ncbi:MAG: Ig-like domain-containing protein, partial [Deefgea sp.]